MEYKTGTLEELGIPLSEDKIKDLLSNTRSIDITFGYEQHILSTHIRNLKDYAKDIKKIVDQKLEKEIKETANSQEDYEILCQEYRGIKDEIPRMLYNPMVVSLWGLLESTIMGYSNFLKDQKSLTYSLKQTNGRSFIAKSKKYFNSYAGLQLSYENKNTLENIQKLRNYVAHTNGNIEFIPSEEYEKLEKVVEKIKGVKINMTNIYVSHTALVYIDSVVTEFIKELQDEISRKYDFVLP